MDAYLTIRAYTCTWITLIVVLAAWYYTSKGHMSVAYPGFEAGGAGVCVREARARKI